MNEQLVKKMLLGNEEMSSALKNIVSSEKCKVYSYSLSSERFIPLYELRIKGLKDDVAYKKVIKGLKKVISFLKKENQKSISIIDVTYEKRFLTIYANELITEIISIIDFTKLGNTENYLSP
jgi:predicted transcriptional regulator